MAICSTATGRRKLWTEESIKAAVSSVLNDNKGLREAARLYNIPVETLRRRSVKPGSKPGPGTILTEEEDKLAAYLVIMADMGYGIKQDMVMEMAFMIAEKNDRKGRAFREGRSGRAWFEGFQRRHPKLTIRSPQALAYNRAICANRETVDELLASLDLCMGD